MLVATCIKYKTNIVIELISSATYIS